MKESVNKLGDACCDVVQAAGNVHSNPSELYAKKDLSDKAKDVSEKVNHILFNLLFRSLTLREKCPNAEFFLILFLLYSDWIQENTDQKKLRIWILFAQCHSQ